MTEVFTYPGRRLDTHGRLRGAAGDVMPTAIVELELGLAWAEYGDGPATPYEDLAALALDHVRPGDGANARAGLMLMEIVDCPRVKVKVEEFEAGLIAMRYRRLHPDFPLPPAWRRFVGLPERVVPWAGEASP